MFELNVILFENFISLDCYFILKSYTLAPNFGLFFPLFLKITEIFNDRDSFVQFQSFDQMKQDVESTNMWGHEARWINNMHSLISRLNIWKCTYDFFFFYKYTKYQDLKNRTERLKIQIEEKQRLLLRATNLHSIIPNPPFIFRPKPVQRKDSRGREGEARIGLI